MFALTPSNLDNNVFPKRTLAVEAASVPLIVAINVFQKPCNATSVLFKPINAVPKLLLQPNVAISANPMFLLNIIKAVETVVKIPSPAPPIVVILPKLPKLSKWFLRASIPPIIPLNADNINGSTLETKSAPNSPNLD